MSYNVNRICIICQKIAQKSLPLCAAITTENTENAKAPDALTNMSLLQSLRLCSKLELQENDWEIQNLCFVCIENLFKTYQFLQQVHAAQERMQLLQATAAAATSTVKDETAKLPIFNAELQIKEEPLDLPYEESDHAMTDIKQEPMYSDSGEQEFLDYPSENATAAAAESAQMKKDYMCADETGTAQGEFLRRYRKCCFPTCISNSQKVNMKTRMFALPKDNEIKNKWMRFLQQHKNDIDKLSKKIYLCNRHFEDKYFGRSCLKKNAVPTLKTSLVICPSALSELPVSHGVSNHRTQQ